MPSGYTAIIQEKPDVTFQEFALGCARAFGACVMQRDASFTDTIEMDEIGQYYIENLESAKQKYKEHLGKTVLGYAKILQTQRHNIIKEYEQYIRNKLALREKYQRMIYEATCYQPPSPDHQGLKNFMLKQLEESMTWDCDTKYYTEEMSKLKTPESKSDTEEYNIELNRLADVVKSAEEALAEEEKRVNNRNKWKTELFKSLEMETENAKD